MRTLASMLALASFGVGCSDLPIVSESDHVTVRSEVPWCDETTDWIDESLVLIGAWLGVAEQDLPRVTVRRYADAETGWTACGQPLLDPRFSACATGSDIAVGNVDMIAHELVHAVGTKVGDPPEWLFEGLAEALQAVPDSRGPVEPSAALFVLIADDATFRSGRQWEHYAQAASFVRYLIDELGREAVIQMYADLPRGASFESLRTYFTDRLGQSLDSLLSRWEQLGPYEFSTVAQPVTGCEAPPIDGEPVRLRPGETTYLALTRDVRAVRRVPPSPSGVTAIHLGTGDCAGVRTTLHACGALAPLYAETAVSPGASVQLVYPIREATHYVEIRTFEEGDPIECGTSCSVAIDSEALAVDACGSARVRLTPGELVQLGGGDYESFVTLESDTDVDVGVFIETPESWVVPPEICHLREPCGASPVECWTADASPHRVRTTTTTAHFRITQHPLDGTPVYFEP